MPSGWPNIRCHAAAWPAPIEGPLSVSVNVAARQLVSPSFPRVVASALTDTGLPADRLWLETTETAIMTDPRTAAEALSQLRGFGLHLALDDFGTGYSSLAYLKRLPVSQLKIDGSFVANMATDEEDAAIVASTIDLARSLGLSVVAEGVESEMVWQQLYDFGCDFVQGYYLSRPLSADQMTRWLEQRESDRQADDDRTAAKVLNLAPTRVAALGSTGA